MNELHEKMGILSAKIDAAHSRIDTTNVLVKEELADVKSILKEISIWMHQSKAKNDLVKYAVGVLMGGGGLAIIKFILTKEL